MRHPIPLAFVGLALAAALSLSAVARGDAKEDAQRHFEAGKSLMGLEDFNAAAVEFELSVSLFATKNGLFNLANCYKALHRYDSAIWAFTRLEMEFGGQMDDKMLDVVSKTKKTLLSVVGNVSIIPSPSGAAVTIDGQVVTASALSNPIFLSPGKHVARAVLSGYRDAEKPFMIVAGAQLVIELQLVSLAPPVAGPRYGAGTPYAARPVPEDPYGTGGPARPTGPAMPMIQPPAAPATQPAVQPVAPPAPAATPIPPKQPKAFDELASWDELSSKGLLESQKPAPQANALVAPVKTKAPTKMRPSENNAFVLGLKKLSPLSWTGLGLTVVTGVTALACWGAANNNYSDFNALGQLYTDGQITADDPDLAAAKKGTLHYGRLATGFGISALLVAAGTTVSIIYDVRKAKKRESLVHAWITPDRVVVRF